MLKANKYRYNYGRQANKTLPYIEVVLPVASDGRPDWAWMDNFMAKYYQGPLKSNVQSPGLALPTDAWAEFRIGTLFDSITKAEAYSNDDLEFGNVLTDHVIPHVTRTDENNAVDSFVVNASFSGLERGNAIVIGDTTATISYQPEDFIAGDHIVVMRARWLNTYTGLFLVSILQKERFRYSYGRAFIKSSIADTRVMLPATIDAKGQKVPDWGWMEQYMKSLAYGDLLE